MRGTVPGPVPASRARPANARDTRASQAASLARSAALRNDGEFLRIIGLAVMTLTRLVLTV
jgi:hypothetical protein